MEEVNVNDTRVIMLSLSEAAMSELTRILMMQSRMVSSVQMTDSGKHREEGGPCP